MREHRVVPEQGREPVPPPIRLLSFQRRFAETVATSANRLAVYRYLVHLVGDHDLAEDLVQETFLRALRAADRFDPGRGPAVAWLVAIARRVQVDHHRSERARRGREQRYATEQGVEVPAPEGAAGLSEGMRDGLRRLTDAEREVVALRVVLGFEGAEVARLLDITPTACSTILHRAMTKLRREVAGDVAA